jgi:hypothetical protein
MIILKFKMFKRKLQGINLLLELINSIKTIILTYYYRNDIRWEMLMR